jgi:hypothetical protein
VRRLLTLHAGVAPASRRLRFLPLVLAALCAVRSAASDKSALAVCRTIEVRSLVVSTERAGTIRDIKTEAIDVASLQDGGMTSQVTVVGPPLGPMDSPLIATEVACAQSGVVLTATITRSAAFNGAVLQNSLWQPTILLAVRQQRPDVLFRTIWRMRRADGRQLTFAQTPPLPGRRFPLVLTRHLR